MSNLICSACYKKILKDNVIVCKICQSKLHKFCAKIDNDKAVSALSNFENIVYNCDNCLQSGCDLVKKVSLLAYEIEELKSLFSQFVSSNNNNNDNSNLSHPSSSLIKTGFESAPRSNLISNFSSIESTISVDVCAASSLPIADNSAAVDNVGDIAVVAGDTVSDSRAVNNAVDTLPNVDVFSDAVSEVALGASSAVNAEWRNVTNRKQNKRRVVVGKNTNSELDVVTKKKWVHLGSFKPSVTAERIISYVSEHLHIDKDAISCYHLIKKDVSPQDLKYVNFKLGVSPEVYDSLFKPEIWTANIKIRPFKFFPKKQPLLAEV